MIQGALPSLELCTFSFDRVEVRSSRAALVRGPSVTKGQLQSLRFSLTHHACPCLCCREAEMQELEAQLAKLGV